MPESVTDRPTKAHEYVFLLAKSERYYFDADAVAEATRRLWIDSAKWACPINWDPPVSPARQRQQGGSRRHTRNIRTVWTIATQPYSGAHFAVFPQELAERCIKAGTSERGVCPVCGEAWERVRLLNLLLPGSRRATRKLRRSQRWRPAWRCQEESDNGWCPTCAHDPDPVPATVLDPFAGSGTTAEVKLEVGSQLHRL